MRRQALTAWLPVVIWGFCAVRPAGLRTEPLGLGLSSIRGSARCRASAGCVGEDLWAKGPGLRSDGFAEAFTQSLQGRRNGRAGSG